MNFWDTSAILPLLIQEKESRTREREFVQNPIMAVWYGTPVEIESALSRRSREGLISNEALRAAEGRWQALAASWVEINPTAQVRTRAIRLLRVHPLRAADAFQLAAALIVCRDQPGEIGFLTSDERLIEAARKEGFFGSGNF